MTVVVDASAVVAALVDGGPDGRWVESLLVGEVLIAPHLMPIEVANILRRSVRGGAIREDIAAMAHDDLVQLPVELHPYEPYATRVWQLGNQVTAYDAWYVAIAESLGLPLVTLDRRLARAPGTTCSFRLPPESASA